MPDPTDPTDPTDPSSSPPPAPPPAPPLPPPSAPPPPEIGPEQARTPNEPGEVGRRGQLFGVVGLVAALVASGVAFAVPWVPEAPEGGQELSEWFPLDGAPPTLLEELGESGDTIAFRSRTIEEVSPLEAFGRIPADFTEGLDSLVSQGGESDDQLGDLERLVDEVDLAIEQVIRLDMTQDPPVPLTSQFLYARTDEGLLEVGFRGEDGTPVRLDPPLLLLPPDPRPGDRWDSEGTANEVPYSFDAEVVSLDDPNTPVRDFSGCIRVEATFVFGEGEGRSESVLSATYCKGIGEVLSSETVDGTLLTRRRLVAAGGERRADLASIPPPLVLADPPPAAPGGKPDTWELSRFGRSLPTGSTGRSTIPPVFVPTDPPMVLAAAEGGDLIAFDAATADERWRFHPDGNIYGAPAFDAESGRLFFGASDRHLYALDARGLFLWAFNTGDNVPTTPLVAGDTVVIGTEAGFAHGIDAATGEERWRQEAGGPITASPVLVDGAAVIGSDDGGLYAFEPETGERRWRVLVGAPIESAPAARDGVVYAADRDGGVVAVDAETGDEIWEGSAESTVRTPVAVSDDLVVVMTDFGRLVGLDRRNGRRRWQTGEIHEGHPVFAGEFIVAATETDEIHVYDSSGRRLREIGTAEASLPDERQTTFTLGGTPGGEALWFADEGSVIRRLGLASGAPPAGFSPLWSVGFIDEPFEGGTLRYSPVPFGDQAVILDASGVVYLMEPGTGEAEKIAVVAADEAATADPVVDGDLLLVSTTAALYAVSLPDGAERWSVPSPNGGFATASPVVAGDTVVWATFSDETGSLQALDRATGEPVWSAPMTTALGGGIEVDGDRVFVGTPPSAFDLATGQPIWQNPLAGNGLGGPAFDAASSTLFVAQIVSPEGGTERATVAALDATTGQVRWEIELPTALSLFERLWVSEGIVVVPTLEGPVFGLDATTGEQRWAYDEPDRFGTTSVVGESVFVVLPNGDLQALDVTTGEVTGEFGGFDLTLDTVEVSFARPVEIDGTLVVTLGFILLGLQEVGR